MMRTFFELARVICGLLFTKTGWNILFRSNVHLLNSLRSRVNPEFHYAQDAEDVPLRYLLPETGFYVDVGAHHPERFSVTKLLYDAGWHGVNIDPSLTIDRDFRARRNRDTNVRALVGFDEPATLFRFNDPALDTSNPERVSYLERIGINPHSFEVAEKHTLESILLSIGAPRKIDLLSIDVEGSDFEVLLTLDWSTRDVRGALVELSVPAFRLGEHPVSTFLEEKGLLPILVFPRSVLFLASDHPAHLEFQPG